MAVSVRRDGAEPRSRFTTAAGTTVHLVEMGAGEPLVLLHGFADSQATWNLVLPALARRRRVIAIDLPGFGDSAEAQERPLLPYYARVLDDVLDQVAGGRRVTLVGNSMGGAVALAHALEHPDRVARLVLVSAAGLSDGTPLWWNLVTSQLAVRALLTPAALAVPSAVIQRVVAQVYSAMVFHRPGMVEAGVIGAFARRYRSRGAIDGLFSLGHDVIAELDGHLARAAAAGLRTPTLLLWGRNDRMVPLDDAVRLHRASRHAHLCVIDGCGHCPQLERPDEFLVAVEAFLRGRPVVVGAGANVLLGDRLPG